MRFAYADPPYLGCCGLYDHEHGDTGDCWDDPETHFQLFRKLYAEFPDGWALSASSSSLPTLLQMGLDDVRVAAWVKPFHAYKKGVRPAYSWEPVIFRGGRNQGHKPPTKGEKATTPKDHLVANITLRKGLTGAKPPEFCRWVLDLLGYQDGDEIVDLFPGTGVMGVVSGETPLQDGLFAGVSG